MRRRWDHHAPECQPTPADNTSGHVFAQVRTWGHAGTPIHPESAMQIAAWYHGPRSPGLTRFAGRGEITDDLECEVRSALNTEYTPQYRTALKALLAYLGAVKEEAP